MFRRFRSIRVICQNEEGTFLVFYALSLSVLLGMVAMSYDVGRLNATDTELQSFADSVALAAAGELDRAPDSITRATAAANNLISDSQTYALGGQALDASDFTLTFYSSLPPSDTTALGATTSNPAQAAYVRVAVNLHTVNYTFGSAFQALTGAPLASANTQAFATAGFTQFVCDISPLMFCLPDAGYRAGANLGNMVNLRARGGPNAAWAPGNFGFLDMTSTVVNPNGPCANASPGQLSTCLLAATGNITQCFVLNGVDLDPGQAVGQTDTAVNTRFDMYDSTVNNLRTNPNFAPAPNVIKGVIPPTNGNGGGGNGGGGGGNGGGGGGNAGGGGGGGGNGPQCVSRTQSQPSTNTVGLGRDTCLTVGGCNRFGDGVWDRQNYIDTNHASNDPVLQPGASAMTGGLAGSRWEMYNAELDISGSGDILSGLDETGRATCAPNSTNDRYRRVIIAAGIDCATYGSIMNGSATGIPVQEFFEIFLTEPVGADVTGVTSNSGIWGEIIGSAGGAGAGGAGGATIHDVVQLYR